MQDLRERVEKGESLSLDAVSPAAQPFLAVLLSSLLPGRPIIVVTDTLKTQEVFQQDIQTWLAQLPAPTAPDSVSRDAPAVRGFGEGGPLFYPSWEVLPDEARLPHVDVISERLETLVALAQQSTPSNPGPQASGGAAAPPSKPLLRSRLVVASVGALLERTLPPGELDRRTRRLRQGDRTGPLDLIEWLEEQGYEPEAQVTQKGDISLRGGIVDLWPLTSRFPVRLEFFGDDLESLRYFDPLTQISRESVVEIVIPPGGELGLLKQALARAGDAAPPAASLLDYLPAGALFLLCEPESLEAQAGRYQSQVQPGHPLLISWRDFQAEAARRGMLSVSVSELEELFPEEAFGASGTRDLRDLGGLKGTGQAAGAFACLPGAGGFPAHWRPTSGGARRRSAAQGVLRAAPSLDAPELRGVRLLQQRRRTAAVRGSLGRIRPGRDQPAANARRRPRPRLPLRSRQAGRGHRRGDFWPLQGAAPAPPQVPARPNQPVAVGHQFFRIGGGRLRRSPSARHWTLLGPATDAFPPRRPSRLHSPAAGDECLVIEYRPSDADAPAPKLYVPVSEAHLVGKYVGSGKARPRLNSLGGARWAKTKSRAEDAVRDLAGEMLAVHAARASQPGHAFPPIQQ